MSIVLWVIFGTLTGWIASVAMKTNYHQGIALDIILGIAGAIVGGFLMGMFDQPGITGFNLNGLAVSVIGAVTIIYLGRTVRLY